MTKPFDLVREVSRFGLDKGIALSDAAMPNAFGLHVDAAMTSALADPALLQGLRVEAMFENLVASLGAVTMIKPEDTGPLRTAEPMQAPDFRVVLEDGTNWLVEVKNIYLADPVQQRRKILSRDYRRALSRYARATGATLKLAVFWARWSVWTVVDPERLAPGDRDLVLDMETAIEASEMGALGDYTIGLRVPLRLRLTMDPARTGPIGEDGMVAVTIGRAQMFSGDRELIHPHDQQIAWKVMTLGTWETPDARAFTEGQTLRAIEFTCAPPQPSGREFDTAGSLSRLFARFYAQHTIREGKVNTIVVPPQDEWFEPFRSPTGPARMPVWRFIQKPSYDNVGSRPRGKKPGKARPARR